ncbi:hypothetical protein SAMN05216371_8331 [Streptomyces sp. TLI_053]|uniref:hypothetical protein n=1 Tax=Streptomyces sp. TLI_053 TaxID=1855352 RepID=UPI00087DCD0C|nr:hypothetical protein [Streptomyces sp. TLI_053]SDS55124.1 hypothetical protein SAMN05216371_0145 [Streptomyces sp. TLI_053]SDT83495.1 hypothetical protein SAMN05216371_8331 [Streptomyces sp. TLI_053]
MTRDGEMELRRRPEELATLYFLEPEIRDVIVEGRGDRNFFTWFVSETPSRGLVRVYAVSDRVDLPDSELIKYGLLTGQRSRVLHLSNVLSELGVDSGAARLVMDADLVSIGLDADAENDLLLRTDFSALEAYAFNERTMNKLLRMGLGAPETVTAADVLTAVTPGLVTLFLIRACLRESGCGAAVPNKAFEKIFSATSLPITVGEIFQDALNGTGKAERGATTKESLLKRFGELEKLVTGDPRHFVNGHDISELVVQFLKARCKSVFNRDTTRTYQAGPSLELLLMGKVDLNDLRHPLFEKLEQWLRESSCPDSAPPV